MLSDEIRRSQAGKQARSAFPVLKVGSDLLGPPPAHNPFLWQIDKVSPRFPPDLGSPPAHVGNSMNRLQYHDTPKSGVFPG